MIETSVLQSLFVSLLLCLVCSTPTPQGYWSGFFYPRSWPFSPARLSKIVDNPMVGEETNNGAHLSPTILACLRRVFSKNNLLWIQQFQLWCWLFLDQYGCIPQFPLYWSGDDTHMIVKNFPIPDDCLVPTGICSCRGLWPNMRSKFSPMRLM